MDKSLASVNRQLKGDFVDLLHILRIEEHDGDRNYIVKILSKVHRVKYRRVYDVVDSDRLNRDSWLPCID